MQAVVPAAGEGTRLRPLTEDTPKGLIEVAGKAILTHCFERLVELGADELLVVVGYEGDRIVEHYGEAFEGTPMTYVEQEERRGLAHAIALTEPHVDGPFFTMNGDNVIRGNLEDVADRFREEGVDGVLLVDEVSREEAKHTGVIDRAPDGAVRSIVEKPDNPPSRLVTTGFAALPSGTVEACRRIEPSDRGEYELPDALTLLIEEGARIETVRLEGWRVNVNTSADVERAETLL
jgi:glucose-1-phosphate thymidylyltransferase